MRKIIYLLITLITLYMAAMFRHTAYFFMAMAELALFFLCFFYAGVTAWQLRVKLLEGDEAGQGRLLVRSNEIFQTDRIRVRLRSTYGSTDEQMGKLFQKKVFLGVLQEMEQEISFSYDAPYCGLINLQVEKVWVYDPIGLFGVGKRQKLCAQYAIFPGEAALPIIYGETRAPGEADNREDLGKKLLGEEEFRQSREYAAGDRLSRIHWNLSARMEQYWVREYEKEPESWILLLLDMGRFSQLEIAGQDAFYRLLSALIRGLLQGRMVCVRWYEGEGIWGEQVLVEKSKCVELLEGLYRKKFALTQADRGLLLDREAQEGPCLRLDAELKLYWRGRLVRDFAEEKLEHALEEEIRIG